MVATSGVQMKRVCMRERERVRERTKKKVVRNR